MHFVRIADFCQLVTLVLFTKAMDLLASNNVGSFRENSTFEYFGQQDSASSAFELAAAICKQASHAKQMAA